MLLALLLFAATPVADSPAYQEAVRLYEAVELEAAAARFQALLGETPVPSERATLNAWLGLIHVQHGESEQARAAFAEAVRLDAAVRLPAPSSPDVEAELEAIRAAAAPPPPPIAAPPIGAASTPGDGGLPAEASPASMPGFVLVGAGAALLAASGLAFSIGLDTAFNQAPAAEFNDEARQLVDVAYAEYAVAAALAAAGIAGLAGGATMLLQ